MAVKQAIISDRALTHEKLAEKLEQHRTDFANRENVNVDAVSIVALAISPTVPAVGNDKIGMIAVIQIDDLQAGNFGGSAR